MLDSPPASRSHYLEFHVKYMNLKLRAQEDTHLRRLENFFNGLLSIYEEEFRAQDVRATPKKESM